MSDRPHFIDARHREPDPLDRALSLPAHVSTPAKDIEKAIAAPARKASPPPPPKRPAPAKKKPPIKSQGGVPVKLTADEAAVIERVLRRAGGGNR